jgi:RNA polymerase sigma factor for flagellar operon FliA
MNGQAMYAEVQRHGTDNEGLADDLETYAPFVKRIAYHLHSRLPASVQIEDLIQSGMIGLLEALDKYDPDQGASFKTYAGIRIRGSMLDEIRVGDWTPRAVRKQSRELAQAVKTVENRKGGEADDQEVADELGVDISDYHRMLTESAGSRMFSLDAESNSDDYSSTLTSHAPPDPQEVFEGQAFKRAVMHSISALPERERLVMALYYDEELTLKEVGRVLDLSESRVCQIHGQALIRLRSRLGDWEQMLS